MKRKLLMKNNFMSYNSVGDKSAWSIKHVGHLLLNTADHAEGSLLMGRWEEEEEEEGAADVALEESNTAPPDITPDKTRAWIGELPLHPGSTGEY